ncbi:uncharacterized protein LOC115228453 isoform X3 [Octopus sinensis]|uniref:Uncharacterized protein LOC115228453 isoform X3 n=1 Tax=Octopus sinensis TaxID=2607531 RepID=A0A7E6EHT7_9MOLL|nr:uncharacterized protein LOC115228453 isoform X3 [Octopus sinensis]
MFYLLIIWCGKRVAMEELLNVEELPTSEEDNGYKWNINNKYYTAQVQLYALPDATSPVCRQYPDSVQAVILYFDANEIEIGGKAIIHRLSTNWWHDLNTCNKVNFTKETCKVQSGYV